jgi:hypothetical protein
VDGSGSETGYERSEDVDTEDMLTRKWQQLDSKAPIIYNNRPCPVRQQITFNSQSNLDKCINTDIPRKKHVRT